MSLTTKIFKANQLRKSRLHDAKGNFAGWKNICLHAAPATASGLLRLTLGYLPEQPWVSYAATKYFKLFLNESSRVLEFGSGMSTIWFSRHAKEVCSVEDFRPWYDKVLKIIEKRGITNINYYYAEGETGVLDRYVRRPTRL